MRRFVLYVVPILLYAGLIFYLSSRTGLKVPKFPYVDKVAHFIEYAILGVLLTRALIGYGVRARTSVVITIVLSSLYGVSDEIHQQFTPGRQSDPLDVVADTLGGTVGAMSWVGLERLRRRPVAERGEQT